MILNKLPLQVPGGLIWKAFAIQTRFEKRNGRGLQNGRGVLYSKKRGVRMELMQWTVLSNVNGSSLVSL